MKIVVLDGYTLNPGDLSWEGIRQFGDLTVYDRIDSNIENVIKTIGDAEIVFTNKTPLPEEVLNKVPCLKYIGILATGYNTVDVNAAGKNGITVTNVPTYGTTAVAQFTFALLLEMCHHVGDHNFFVKRGDWTTSNDFCFWNFPLIELAEKTIGLIGFGRIGQATAKIALSFGLKVLAFDNVKNHSFIHESCKCVSLEELFCKSDIISLHCPLFDSTRGIINKENIKKMKDGVMIINTARGPLIMEEDLAEALNNGKVSAAAVDVVTIEPISPNNPLLKAKNCIITPHIAWAPKESRARLMNTAVENLDAFLKGQRMNVINVKNINL
jgi:glycerate dehydrogenase